MEANKMEVNKMEVKRKRRSAQFKFQVALEAAKGTKTVNELAQEYSVHPTQISHWKRQLLEEGDGGLQHNDSATVKSSSRPVSRTSPFVAMQIKL